MGLPSPARRDFLFTDNETGRHFSYLSVILCAVNMFIVKCCYVHVNVQDGNAGVVVKHGHQKSHRTPWGKVKDIIQTRKDSLKKRHRHKSEKNTSESAVSDHEDESSIAEPSARDSPEKDAPSTVSYNLNK